VSNHDTHVYVYPILSLRHNYLDVFLVTGAVTQKRPRKESNKDDLLTQTRPKTKKVEGPAQSELGPHDGAPQWFQMRLDGTPPSA